MAGWRHWLDGHESEWTPGDGDGQGGLACCDSWGHKESDTTERLIWSDLIWFHIVKLIMFPLWLTFAIIFIYMCVYFLFYFLTLQYCIRFAIYQQLSFIFYLATDFKTDKPPLFCDYVTYSIQLYQDGSTEK